MLEIIKPNPGIDFVGRRYVALGLSGLLLVASLLSLVFAGLRYGVDFTGGTLVHLRTAKPIALAALREAFAPEDGATLQDVAGAENEYLVRLPASSSALETTLSARLDATLGRGGYELLRVEVVGPSVGADLRSQAVHAVLFTTLVIGAYVAWRFEPRFGVGAALALVHDVLVTLGVLVVSRREIDLTVVAALLTVVGFSVNDTVIVSDRIRENRRKYPRMRLPAVVNLSINETLSRTVLTTGTALLVVLSLFALGGNVIHGFAFTLLVGLTVGTYSSIFIAIPIVLVLGSERPRRLRGGRPHGYSRI